ncbi:MAG: hypothetical protein KAR45_22620 [Desulfobacteraceae bacterium]|nr:hypothetical protein [Desulfobacteraceae bacterium]
MSTTIDGSSNTLPLGGAGRDDPIVGPGGIQRNAPAMHILPSYVLGTKGKRTAMKARAAATKNPILAFACVAAYFAGEKYTVQEDKLDEYEEKHEDYKNCLTWSKYAHERKARATELDKACSGSGGFKSYVSSIIEGSFNDMDKGNDNKHNKDEWQAFIDVINKEKDIQSTDLNKISTEMDMAVKDCSEAEQMAANAVKRANDLMSTQGKTAGG